MKKINRPVFISSAAPCVIAGLCFGLSFPPINLNFLMFAGFAILMHLISETTGLKSLFKKTYLVFFTFALVALSWLMLSGLRESADRFLLLGGLFVLLLYPVIFFVPLAGYYFTVRKFRITKFPHLTLFLFPFFWTAFDYLQTMSEFSFPWILTGNAFTGNLNKIQFIEYTGVYGISFWASVIGVLFYYLFTRLKNNYLAKNNFEFRSASNILLYAAILLTLLTPDFYGLFSSSNNKYTLKSDEEKINVAVIQPNINPWLKWGSKQTALTQQYADMIREAAGSDTKPDLIILPETAFPYYLLDPYYDDKYSIVKNVVDSIGIPLLTGTPDLVVYQDSSLAPVDAKVFKGSGFKYDSFNSAVLLEKGKNKSDLQKYDKIKLVGASERMPYQRKFPFLSELITWGVGLSSYQIGKDSTIFVLNNRQKFNTAICYESIFPGFFAAFINNGADFSVIITNDGWWGKLFGTYQHAQYAVLRAIENRRWIVRCANTGISSFIDPYGNIYNQTEIDQKAIIYSGVGIVKEKTFYTLHGDIFAGVCLYVSLIILFGAILYGIFAPRKSIEK